MDDIINANWHWHEPCDPDLTVDNEDNGGCKTWGNSWGNWGTVMRQVPLHYSERNWSTREAYSEWTLTFDQGRLKFNWITQRSQVFTTANGARTSRALN